MTLAQAVDYGPYTIDDYDALPDDGQRYELINGRIVVSPRPTMEHQDVADELRSALRRALPKGCSAHTDCEITFANRRECLAPDVLVISPRRARRQPRAEASRVLLAVEVVSPSSTRTDRSTKPPIYAAAGIPSYWVVETDPFSVTQYGLTKDRCEEVQVVTGDQIVVALPFDMKIDLARARAAMLIPDV